jgi:hypothetical protein
VVTILETLSTEDLERFRTAALTLDMIEARPPTLTLTEEEIRRAYLDYHVLFGELMERYGIKDEEAIEAKISLSTGHIYVGAEE